MKAKIELLGIEGVVQAINGLSRWAENELTNKDPNDPISCISGFIEAREMFISGTVVNSFQKVIETANELRTVYRKNSLGNHPSVDILIEELLKFFEIE